MRNLKLLVMAIFFGTTAAFAIKADDKVAERNTYRYNNSFIFEENGISFAVYPDGEFDFYINDRIRNRNRNVTFNSGFDYSPYAQYDDYGAVIQVENIPIFYDNYGRVSTIGSVDIGYRNGRVRRLGNMFVYYNNRGFYDYHTGFINVYNRNYVYRPFHRLFSRPALNFCLVNRNPYRRFYTPFRYTYYTPYRFNRRNAFANIGKTYRNNNVRRDRAAIYKNDRRVSLRKNNVRSNRNVGSKTNTVVRNNRVTRPVTNRTRTNTTSNRNGSAVKRTQTNGRTVTRSTVTKRTPQRSVTKRTPTRTSVTKRTVTRTPRNTSVVNRRTTSNRGTTSNRSTASNRSTTSRKSSTSTTRSNRNSYSRSASSRSSRARL